MQLYFLKDLQHVSFVKFDSTAFITTQVASKDENQEGREKSILIIIPLNRSYSFVGGLKSPFSVQRNAQKNYSRKKRHEQLVEIYTTLQISFVKLSFESATAIKKYKSKKSS